MSALLPEWFWWLVVAAAGVVAVVHIVRTLVWAVRGLTVETRLREAAQRLLHEVEAHREMMGPRAYEPFAADIELVARAVLGKRP